MNQEELLRAVAAGQITYWAAKDKVVMRPVPEDREVRAPGEVISFVDLGLVERALVADLITCEQATLGAPKVPLELTAAGREALALLDQARELASA